MKQELLWDVVRRSREDLQEDDRQRLYHLLLGYADVFASDEADLGRTGMVKHKVDSGSSSPIRQGPRRVPLSNKRKFVSSFGGC